MTPLNIFLELVAIPSPLYKVSKIQGYLANFVSTLFPDALTIRDNAGHEHPDFEGGNLLIILPASPGMERSPVLAVEAHVDTVKEEGIIHPVVSSDRVTSDGTTILGADDKGGLAAICAALQIVQHFPHGPIQIIFSVGEESSMYGMRVFDFSEIKARGILCVDGFSPREIITACAGKIKYRATFTGKESHGAEPEKSVNAIELATAAINDCVTYHFTGRLESGTIHNIAEFQSHEGPSQYPSNNTIPGKCSVSGELRGHNDLDLKNTFEIIKGVFQTTAKRGGGKAEFEILIPYKPFTITDDNTILLRLKDKNPEIDFQYVACDGSTHSNIYNEHGLESVVIGAGGRNPHAHDEYLIIAELNEAVRIIANYLII